MAGGVVLGSTTPQGHHNALKGRSDPNCHPIDSIEGLRALLEAIVAGGAPVGNATPAPVATTGDGSPGTSLSASREDHQHAIPLATATTPGVVVLGEGGAQPWTEPGSGGEPSIAGDATEVGVFTEDGNLVGQPTFTATETLVTAPALKATDQAGTGERMVLAGEDGTQRAEAKVKWVEGVVGLPAYARFVRGVATFSPLEITDSDPNPSDDAFEWSTALLVTSGGRWYLWHGMDQKCWWSDDDGSTWAGGDAIAGVPSYLGGVIGLKDGVETMLLVNDEGYYGAWATLATPPVVTAFSLPFGAVARVSVGADGEFLLTGSVYSNPPVYEESGFVGRYVSGAWAWADVRVGGAYYTLSAFKTAAGVYLVGASSYDETEFYLVASSDFSSWAVVDTEVLGQGRAVFGEHAGRTVCAVYGGGYPAGNTIFKFSDTGLSWTTATAPEVGDSISSIVWDDVNNQFVCTSYSGSILTSPDGATWTLAGTLAAEPFAPGASYGGFVAAFGTPTPTTKDTVEIQADADLRITDMAGTGERVALAGADGTLRAEASLSWLGGETPTLQVSGLVRANNLRSDGMARANTRMVVAATDGTLQDVPAVTWQTVGPDGLLAIAGGLFIGAEVKTSSFTAVAGRPYIVDASAEAIDVTMPADPTVGCWVGLLIINADHEVGVVPDTGDKLMGGTERMTFARAGDGADMTYTGSAFGWSPRSAISVSRQNVPMTAADLAFAPTAKITADNTQAAIEEAVEQAEESAFVYAMIMGGG